MCVCVYTKSYFLHAILTPESSLAFFGRSQSRSWSSPLLARIREGRVRVLRSFPPSLPIACLPPLRSEETKQNNSRTKKQIIRVWIYLFFLPSMIPSPNQVSISTNQSFFVFRKIKELTILLCFNLWSGI